MCTQRASNKRRVIVHKALDRWWRTFSGSLDQTGGMDHQWLVEPLVAVAEPEVVAEGGILHGRALGPHSGFAASGCRSASACRSDSTTAVAAFSGSTAWGGSSDPVTYGSRVCRKGSVCQLWHACHRFAITALDPSNASTS